MLRKLIIGASVPLVALVVVGVLAPRAEDRRDSALKELKVFSEAFELVSRHYVEDVDFRQLERGAYQGLAENLDPWSSYYDPVHARPLLARDRSGDTGLLLIKHPQQYVRVAAITPGSPADTPDISRGAFIETIDGLETKDLTLFEAQAMLAGPPATTVKIGFFREDDEKAGKIVELGRRDLSGLRVVASRERGAAVLRVTDCRSGIAPLVKTELDLLKAAGIERLVLDLRTNVGGTPEDAAALASLFTGAGAVARRITRGGASGIEGLQEKVWTGGLVVLTSRATIGEAELVADALRARRGVALIGQPTFGKTTQQDLVLLPDGTGLVMSVAQYQRADGSAFPEKGIEPDETVAAIAAESDLAAIAPDSSVIDDESDPLILLSGSSGAAPADAGGKPEGATPQGAPAPPGPSSTEAKPATDPQMHRALEILGGSPVKPATPAKKAT